MLNCSNTQQLGFCFFTGKFRGEKKKEKVCDDCQLSMFIVSTAPLTESFGLEQNLNLKWEMGCVGGCELSVNSYRQAQSHKQKKEGKASAQAELCVSPECKKKQQGEHMYKRFNSKCYSSSLLCSLARCEAKRTCLNLSCRGCAGGLRALTRSHNFLWENPWPWLAFLGHNSLC